METMRNNQNRTLIVLSLALGIAGCADEEIDSDEAARRAYLCLDPSIAKSLELGFAGFNSAQSANISPQSAAGTATGTMTVTGQVDQGSSDNKGMRLRVKMLDWSVGVVQVPMPDSDPVGVKLTYNTAEAVEMQPYLQLQLRNIPSGTFTGTLTGTYAIRGDLEGDVVLNLSMSGNLQAVGSGTQRAAGTTTVTGTATSGEGVYMVNVRL